MLGFDNGPTETFEIETGFIRWSISHHTWCLKLNCQRKGNVRRNDVINSFSGEMSPPIKDP